VTILAASRPATENQIANVMICDDSLVIRGAIARILESDPAVRVVAKVGNGRAAIEELRRTAVDVLVLDIEMPVLDGTSAPPPLACQRGSGHPAQRSGGLSWPRGRTAGRPR